MYSEDSVTLDLISTQSQFVSLISRRDSVATANEVEQMCWNYLSLITLFVMSLMNGPY